MECAQMDMIVRDADTEKYEAFVDKFKPTLTTDDCYTPPLVYDAVAEFVATEYGVDKARFVRPFYPGGDYEREDYTGKIVVDNPPFSLLAQIKTFFIRNGVPFFLFAPSLTLISGRIDNNTTHIACGVSVTYANGANVNTSFVTNMDDREIVLKTSPRLYSVVNSANMANVKRQKKAALPKYTYPNNVITAAIAQRLCKYGIDYALPRVECVRISALDEQRTMKKNIFGGGLLLSEKAAQEKAAQEKAAQEKAAAICWKLSERERNIVMGLGV